MKNGRWLLGLIVLFALFSANAVSQQQGETNSAQNASPTTNEKQSLPRPHWMVKYISGSLGLKSDRWLEIAFVSRLEAHHIANASASVPADQLVAIEFNPKTETESDLLQRPRSGCSYARKMMPDTSKNRPEVLVATAIVPGPVSRLSESLIPKHPVRLAWGEAGEQKSMIVEVNDCEYESLIANFRWLAGSRWQEIEHESRN